MGCASVWEGSAGWALSGAGGPLPGHEDCTSAHARSLRSGAALTTALTRTPNPKRARPNSVVVGRAGSGKTSLAWALGESLRLGAGDGGGGRVDTALELFATAPTTEPSELVVPSLGPDGRAVLVVDTPPLAPGSRGLLWCLGPEARDAVGEAGVVVYCFDASNAFASSLAARDFAQLLHAGKKSLGAAPVLLALTKPGLAVARGAGDPEVALMAARAAIDGSRASALLADATSLASMAAVARECLRILDT